MTCCIIACVSPTASQDKLQAAKTEVQGAMWAEGRERQVSEVLTRTPPAGQLCTLISRACAVSLWT